MCEYIICADKFSDITNINLLQGKEIACLLLYSSVDYLLKISVNI